MSGAKDRFYAKYPGPRGPHLSYLTQTTMTGEYDPKNQESIHPRVKGGRQVHAKVNTAK